MKWTELAIENPNSFQIDDCKNHLEFFDLYKSHFKNLPTKKYEYYVNEYIKLMSNNKDISEQKL